MWFHKMNDCICLHSQWHYGRIPVPLYSSPGEEWLVRSVFWILPVLKLWRRGSPAPDCVALMIHGAFRVAQLVRNMPAMWETCLQSLGWEDPLEEGMTTHSSILAWRIPVNRGTWRATVHGVRKSRTRLSDWAQYSTMIRDVGRFYVHFCVHIKYICMIECLFLY